jgi:hypothetical protein
MIPTALVMKLPPFPAGDDVDRTTFQSIPISITPPDGLGVTNAIVQFGYAENGAPGDFYCTSRLEVCVANVPAIDQSNPFHFASEGAGGVVTGLPGVSCANGCTIPLPALSQRALYYRVLYRDDSNTVLSTGPLQVKITQ